MRPSRPLAIATTLVGIVVALPGASAAPPPFRLTEATIAQAQQAMTAGRLTCRQLVEGYLARIAAYDRKGPALQSVIVVSTTAGKDAIALDKVKKKGRLHCVPVLLKDNIDAKGLPTTGGATALTGARPPDDAFVVRRLRAEGAIVLGKANLDEFAFGFQGSSSVGGQVKNAYDVTRGPGGSSSGTGAAIAASFAMVGLGTDTGGSIRVPSSVEGLVGIRPTMRLLSQDGVLPLAHFQDTAGPMCRTVQDCALLLQVMVGHDPAGSSGQYTKPEQRDDTGVLLKSDAAYRSMVRVAPDAYTKVLDPRGLRGARIGVVRALFGNDAAVAAVLNAAIARMRRAGATVEDVTIPDLSTITGYSSVSQWEFHDDLTSYLSSWPSAADGHKRSFEEVAASLGYQPSNTASFALYGGRGLTRHQDPDYQKNTVERPAYVRPRLQAALNHSDVSGKVLGRPYDALLYPSVQSLPTVGGPPSTGSNNRLSPFSGFPALTMPAGFTARTPTQPALPVGMELLGREFAEPTLLRLAYGYQVSVQGSTLARQAPTTTPELASGARNVPASSPVVQAPHRTLAELLGN